MLEQRECTGFAGDIAQDYIHKTRIKAKANTPCRLFDGVSQHIRVHWTNEELLGRDPRREIRPGRAFRQEIRPHRQHHCRLAIGNRRRIDQIAEE